MIMPNGKPTPPVAGDMRQASATPQRSIGGFQQWAQQRYGRQASPQELQQIGTHVGYSGQGPISEEMWTRATQYSDELAKQQGWKPPQTQPPVGPSIMQGWRGPSFQNGQHARPEPMSVFPTMQAPQTNQAAQAIVDRMLANPHTMGQQWQDQQFEQQKELSNSLRQQMGANVSQAAAGRGVGSGSGATQAILSGLDEELASQLLGARRDISGRAAIQNRQDELNALQMNEALTQGNFGRNLATNHFNADNAYRTHRANAEDLHQANQFGLQSWLAEGNMGLERDRFNALNQQFNRTFGLDMMRFLEGQRQFNAGFGENQRQFNNSNALDWYRTNLGQGNQFLNYIMGLF